MSPKLYMLEGSPPVRSVLLIEQALGIQLEHEPVNLATGEHLKPEYLKINPQHTVPTLVDEDGSSLWDSHAIMPYLVEKYAKNDQLFPKNYIKQSLVNKMIFFDSGVASALLYRILGPLITQRQKTVDEDCVKSAHTTYDFLNTFLQGNDWVTGNELTVADFCIITSITSLNYLVPIDDKYKNVLVWIKRFENLSYYNEEKRRLKLFEVYVDHLMGKV